MGRRMSRIESGEICAHQHHLQGTGACRHAPQAVAKRNLSWLPRVQEGWLGMRRARKRKRARATALLPHPPA